MTFFSPLIALFLTMSFGHTKRTLLQEHVTVPQYMQLPPPLTKTVSSAQLIVVGRLVKVSPKPHAHGVPMSTLEDEPISAGKYSFEVVYTLKGYSDHRLTIDTAAATSLGYNGVSFPVVPGKLVLLFLVPSLHSTPEVSKWSAADPYVPLTPLPATIDIVTAGNANAPIITRVVGILLSTMSDPQLRKANSPLLEKAIDPRLPKALLPFIDDPDRDTRVSICAALAANQEIAAIPRITQLEVEMMQGARGRNCIDALGLYKTTAALPLLNPLVFDSDEFTRRNAMTALRNIASKKSIPYLVLALRDPLDDIAYDAYATLNRLLPQFGPLQTTLKFEAHRAPLCASYYAWWREEMEGKHRAGAMSQKSKHETPPKNK